MVQEYDLVIRNGNVADGNGGPIIETDIAVRDGTIARIGKSLGSGKEEIDARGKLITPGFVDIHTHYDGQATWDSRLQPSSWHGVTTVVMGNCGVGFAPVRPKDHDLLIELMEGVEDIPGTALHEGLRWTWESFGEYLDALEKRSYDMDVCAQLPHGSLRVYVMGKRAARLEMATKEDMAEMRRLTADAMRAGAIGFSTSRTLLHKTVKGDPTPSLRAGHDELMAIAMGLADAGSGVMELISDYDNPDYPTEFEMIRKLVQASGRPLSLSLSQSHSRPAFWRELLRDIETARKDGLIISGQVAPRPVGMLMGMQCSLNPFMCLPSFIALGNRPLAEKVAIMRDPAFRAKLMTETPVNPERHQRVQDTGMMFPLGDPPNYEPPPELSLRSLAKARNREPLDLVYDMLLENEGKNFLFKPFANYIDGHLDACGEMLAHPNCVVGLGDGGAHVGYICDGSFPTYLLTHWGRDRSKGRFNVGWLVKRQTADTARAVGLSDRGVLAPGMKADVNVIDFDKLAVKAPNMVFDLPAGGKRLLQRATGYEATIVSGQVTYREGEETGALPGKLVRQKAQ